MRSKFGGKGDEEEDEDDIEKKEMEDHDRRAKHSIEGILGDRCEWAARCASGKLLALTLGGVIFYTSVTPHS